MRKAVNRNRPVTRYCRVSGPRGIVLLAALVLLTVVAVRPVVTSALDDGTDSSSLRDTMLTHTSPAHASSRSSSAESICHNCGGMIPADTDVCPHCGWPSSPTPARSSGQFPFRVVDFGTREAEVTFTGLEVPVGGDPARPSPGSWLVKLHWGKDARTAEVPLGRRHHGFMLASLREGQADPKNPGTGQTDSTRSWLLTLTKPGCEAIVLEISRSRTVEEDYAIIERSGTSEGTDSFEIFEGEKFPADGRIYEVVSISNVGVIISDIPARTILEFVR